MLGRLRGRASSSAPPDDELFGEDFQRRLDYLALVSRRTFRGRTRAERRSRETGAGVEFADYRGYAAGDDYRHVDWNIYGRTDRLVLRLYEQEQDLVVYLLLDCSASMGMGQPSKLLYAKRLAAALAYVGLHHLDRVSITAFDASLRQRLPPGRGRNRIFAVFDYLRGQAPSGRTDLKTAISTFVAQNRRRGVAVLISDLYDTEGFEAGIDQLRFAKFETHVLHVVDPSDTIPTALGDVELVDAESGERRLATLSPAALQRYAQARTAYLERVRRFCVRKQVPLHEVDTRTPPDEAVLGILRRGGLVR
jgi:uncharacterized protein (DUF58 family)